MAAATAPHWVSSPGVISSVACSPLMCFSTAASRLASAVVIAWDAADGCAIALPRTNVDRSTAPIIFIKFSIGVLELEQFNHGLSQVVGALPNTVGMKSSRRLAGHPARLNGAIKVSLASRTLLQ